MVTSVETYKAIFENTGTAMAIIEDDDTVSLVNTEFETLSGYTKAEIEGNMVWMEFVHAVSRRYMQELHQKRKIDPLSAPKSYEFLFCTRTGETKNILVTIDFIPETKRSIAALLDITDNKQTQKELEHRLDFERTLLKISQSFITISEKNLDRAIDRALETIGRFSHVDRSYLFLLSDDMKYMSNTHEWCNHGASPQKQNLQNLKTADFWWTIDQLTRFGIINIPSLDHLPPGASFERSILSTQGIKSAAIISLSYEGTVKGFIGFDSTVEKKVWTEKDFILLQTLADIFVGELQRKKFKDKLTRSEQKYRDFVNFLPQVVFEADLKGTLTFVNQHAFTLFGYTTDEFSRGLSLFDMIDEREKQSAEHNVAEIAAGTVTKGNEYTGKTKDGRLFPVLVYSSAVYEQGSPVGVRGIIIDISVRKKLEEQLQQSQKMEAIGRLAGEIAHDFNNILTSIIGHGNILLLDQHMPSEYRKEVEQIISTAKSGASLTRQLLTFSKSPITEPKKVNINKIILDTKKIIDRLIDDSVTIETVLMKPLRKILADPTHIKQIIMNLLINSADAMPYGGTISIRTENCTSMEQKQYDSKKNSTGEYIAVHIEDTGCGMDRETKLKVVEPFFTTKEAGKGTGLGLSIVYGIVTQYGGYLNIDSEPNKGTSVSVYLPV